MTAALQEGVASVIEMRLSYWSSRALMLCVLIALYGVWLGVLWVLR